VLAAVVDTLGVRADQRQMSIALHTPADLPRVVGDMDQLTQVFHNLIDNAVKYARTGTVIRIVASPVARLPGTQTPGVSVAVSDEGDGIEAIHIPRLTERFYRADEGRSRRLGGTGLGLAIVKHIVNRHRGRLIVESTVGVGSTFSVFLPSVPASASTPLPPTSAPPASPASRAPGAAAPRLPGGEALRKLP
jgi:two-component system, OmpR family, phosphate regulon sensor histidine kinase PhoR